MMPLISNCLHVDLPGMVGCLALPGPALPGKQEGGITLSSCLSYDKMGLLECLTGVGEECCFVLGLNGCTTLINGQMATIF